MKIQLTCETCGQKFFRNPFEAAKSERHYCSRACASKKHGEKIAGEKNGRWRGGSIESRGPSWETTRAQVIESFGGKCACCGMTNDAHIEKYRKSLHVHHNNTPYRLKFDNSTDNLIPVCIPCHPILERAQRLSLSEDDLEIMLQNSIRARSLGLDKIRDRSVPCPDCGKPKAKRSLRCRRCNALYLRSLNELRTCKICGIEISDHSNGLCINCYHLSRRKAEPHPCSVCGSPVKKQTASLCRPCSAKLNGKKYTGKS